MINCKICNENINLKAGTFSRWHLDKIHNIKSKDYYDIYIKCETEEKCKTCGSQTSFLTYTTGYQDFCSSSCGSKNKEVKAKILKTKSEKYGNNGFQSEKYKQTLKEKYGVENISQIDEVKKKKEISCFKKWGVSNPLQAKENKDKAIQTSLKNYGVPNPSKSEIVKTKRKKTTLKRYGNEYYAQSIFFRTFMELKGEWIPLEQKTEFELYSKKVWKTTRKFIKQLFENWNGKCYYSNKKLETNTKKYNEMLYRTIDHKISIYYGFINKINPEEIGNINNLCICSRELNIKKGLKTEEQFKIN